MIKRGGGEPGLPEVEVHGEAIAPSEPARIRILPEYPLAVKASAVLRDKLGLSGSAFVRLCDSGQIRCVSGQDIKKCRLTGEIVVEIG